MWPKTLLLFAVIIELFVEILYYRHVVYFGLEFQIIQALIR